MQIEQASVIVFCADRDNEEKIVSLLQLLPVTLNITHSIVECRSELERGSFNLCLMCESSPDDKMQNILQKMYRYAPGMLTCLIGSVASPPPGVDFYYDMTLLADDTALQQNLTNMVRLTRKIHTQSELSAILIHDLRSPTQSIIGYLELLQKQVFGEVNEGQMQIVNSAAHLSDHLVYILEELTQVHLFEHREFLLDKSTINLKEAADRALRSLWIQADKKEIKFVPQIPATLPAIVADGPRLERVLINLITNAIFYTPEKGTIRITAETMDKAGKVRSVIFRVIDSGPGIPEDELEIIFDKYYRVRGKTPKHKGFGLGLYICRLIVEAHSGQIGAVNNREGGSTFYFSLPVS